MKVDNDKMKDQIKGHDKATDNLTELVKSGDLELDEMNNVQVGSKHRNFKHLHSKGHIPSTGKVEAPFQPNHYESQSEA
jgi:hypothetical protein